MAIKDFVLVAMIILSTCFFSSVFIVAGIKVLYDYIIKGKK